MQLFSKDWQEKMTVGIVMMLILMPVRVLFYSHISQSWIGSLGLISAITVTMVYLSEKNKLGKFSGMFKRQMYRFHKGKRKYYIYAMTGIQFFLLINIIYAIEIADSFKQTKTEIKALMPNYANVKDVLADYDEVKPTDFLMAFAVWGWLYIYHYDMYASIISIMNDLTHGYMLHFSFVLLIEAFEVSGIMIYTRWRSKKYAIESS